MMKIHSVMSEVGNECSELPPKKHLMALKT